MTRPTSPEEIAEALAAPFPPDEIQWKPGIVKGERCLALAYADARTVMDRLDAVLGIDGWQDQYHLLPGGEVVCTLRCRIAGEWVSKSDVGGQSEQPDEGDRMKAAFSDALKRAAVKFSVGRFLYSLPSSWVDFDPKTKKITNPPKLPAWAMPKPAAKPTNGEKKPQPVEQKQAVAPPVSAAEVDAMLASLKANGRAVPAMMKWLGLPPDTPVSDLTRAQYTKAAAKLAEGSGKIQKTPTEQAMLRKGELDQERLTRIEELWVRLGGNVAQLLSELKKQPGVTDPKYLTAKEADQLIARLEMDLEAQKQEVSP